jgi:hypothetical protein
MGVMIIEKMNFFVEGRSDSGIFCQIEIKGGCASPLRSDNDEVG